MSNIFGGPPGGTPFAGAGAAPNFQVPQIQSVSMPGSGQQQDPMTAYGAAIGRWLQQQKALQQQQQQQQPLASAGPPMNIAPQPAGPPAMPAGYPPPSGGAIY